MYLQIVHDLIMFMSPVFLLLLLDHISQPDPNKGGTAAASQLPEASWGWQDGAGTAAA